MCRPRVCSKPRWRRLQRSRKAFSTRCRLDPGTRLTTRVKAREEEHTVTVAKVLSWLDGIAASPSEKLKKNRLRERLRS